MRVYHCPFCKSPIPKKIFDQVKRDSKAQVALAAQAAMDKQRNRYQPTIERQKDKIDDLQRSNNLLKRGITAQVAGVEFERKLYGQLRAEFREDEITNPGKPCDIIHAVRVHGKPSGLIIYECKETAKWSDSYIRQAYASQRKQEADFAIVVSAVQRRGFGGIDVKGKVCVVAPLAVVPLVRFIREYLVEVYGANLNRKERSRITAELLGYIRSAQFRGPLEDAIRQSEDLQASLIAEMKSHVRTWQQRWNRYETIRVDCKHIEGSVHRILQGGKPLTLKHGKPEPLPLPAPSDSPRRTW